MKLADQVITLQQAKRLKELGFIKPSFFSRKATFKGDDGNCKWEVLPSEYYEMVETAPAYTLSELGEFLPDGYSTMRRGGKRRAYNPPIETSFWAMVRDTVMSLFYRALHEVEPTIEANEVQTRCALLIDLLETGVLLPELEDNG